MSNNNGHAASTNGTAPAAEQAAVAYRPEPQPTPRLPEGTLPTNPVGGQATLIEQSRAQQQVNVQAMLARQFPRDIEHAKNLARETCETLVVAERAFFEFKRSGSRIHGETIHLARELARCWGNLDYGIAELVRDDKAGHSEMMAWAWDLETNARVSNIFIAPHIRDTSNGPKELASTRDLYENNANLGARRLRECIFNVLPKWFIQAAANECRTTIQRGADAGKAEKPLLERINGCVATFAKLGVTVEQLEAKVSKPKSQWGPEEIADLGVTFTSLKNKEITKEEAFEDVSTTEAEILAQAADAERERSGQQ